MNSGERIRFLHHVSARGFVTPSKDVKAILNTNPSLFNFLPDGFQMFGLKAMFVAARSFPLLKRRRGVISPKIFHQHIDISL